MFTYHSPSKILASGFRTMLVINCYHLPTKTLFPHILTLRGPPESPLQTPTKPQPDVHIIVFGRKSDRQSEFVITIRSTSQFDGASSLGSESKVVLSRFIGSVSHNHELQQAKTLLGEVREHVIHYLSVSSELYTTLPIFSHLPLRIIPQPAACAVYLTNISFVMFIGKAIGLIVAKNK